jgi:hypothetical protein
MNTTYKQASKEEKMNLREQMKDPSHKYHIFFMKQQQKVKEASMKWRKEHGKEYYEQNKEKILKHIRNNNHNNVNVQNYQLEIITCSCGSVITRKHSYSTVHRNSKQHKQYEENRKNEHQK